MQPQCHDLRNDAARRARAHRLKGRSPRRASCSHSRRVPLPVSQGRARSACTRARAEWEGQGQNGLSYAASLPDNQTPDLRRKDRDDRAIYARSAKPLFRRRVDRLLIIFLPRFGAVQPRGKACSKGRRRPYEPRLSIGLPRSGSAQTEVHRRGQSRGGAGSKRSAGKWERIDLMRRSFVSKGRVSKHMPCRSVSIPNRAFRASESGYRPEAALAALRAAAYRSNP